MRSHPIPASVRWFNPPLGLGSPLPKSVRLATLRRDEHRCRLCHRRTDLHVHHIDRCGQHSPTPNHAMANLVTLCRRCHRTVHAESILVTPELLARAQRIRRGEEVLIAKPVLDPEACLVGNTIPKRPSLAMRPEVAFFIEHPEEDCQPNCACGMSPGRASPRGPVGRMR